MNLENKEEEKNNFFENPKESNNFKEHLEIEDNKKIIFSGKFGIGKTVFLEMFFKEEEKYETTHLFLTNYAIRENEDIIDFLRTDIFLKQYGKGEKKKLIEKILKKKLGENSKEERLESFEKFLKNVFKVSQKIEGLYNIVKNLYEFYNKITPKNTDEKNIFDKEDFLLHIEKDFLLEEILNLEKYKTQEKILILDDFDRIDPKHIFRILNILSAVFEGQNKKIKFGFDKIILVCDYNNLVNIFKHFYGEGTDYNGYFDKFYSQEIFYLTDRDVVNSFVYSGSLKSFSLLEIFYINLIQRILLDATKLSTKNKLVVRNLSKISKPRNIDIKNFLNFQKYLTSIFGDVSRLTETLENIIEEIRNRNRHIKNLNFPVEEFSLDLQKYARECPKDLNEVELKKKFDDYSELSKDELYSLILVLFKKRLDENSA